MKNYQELAMRTNAPTAGTHGNVPADLIHAVLGMMDEVKEFHDAKNDTNAIEEIGDLMWFCALAADSIGVDLMWDDLPMPNTSLYFFEPVGEISGLVKKPYAYGPSKPLPVAEIGQHLRTIISLAVAVCGEMGVSLQSVLESNIEKLRVRFPEKFETEQAWHRDTKAEARAIDFVRSLSDAPDYVQQELDAFVKDADEYMIMTEKEVRDQALAEYEYKYRLVDTRMISETHYVVAGWQKKGDL